MNPQILVPNPNRIILAADSHALHYAQQCKRKYYLAHVEGLVSRRKRKALDLGHFIHDCIHRINRARLRNRRATKWILNDLQLVQLAYKRMALFVKKGKWDKKWGDVVFHQMKIMQWFSVAKNHWLKPIATEIGFSKPIYETKDVLFIYRGRIDTIARVGDTDLVTWTDYKTQSKEYKLYEHTNQFIGYSWALDANIGFIWYYGLQKEKAAEDCFRVKTVHQDPGLIDQWKADTIQSFYELAGIVPLGEKAFRRNRSACNEGIFGNCQYTPLCDNAFAPAEVLVGIKRMNYKPNEWHPWKELEEDGGDE